MLAAAFLLQGLGLASGRVLFLSRREALEASGAPAQACTELVNHGTHFTVDVEVGTPGQKFSVIADTGSNTLIVPSCVCQRAGGCDATDRCFTGTNRSSSFSLVNSTGALLLTFGSGQIQGVVARETVRVGNLSAFMDDGIMLMTAKALSFGGPFEGILGLGIPRQENQTVRLSPPRAARGSAITRIGEIIRKIEDEIKSRRAGGGAAPPSQGNIAVVREDADFLALATSAEGELALHQPGGFLEQAHIGRFSMCFNDGANGVLRIGTPPAQAAHGSMGKVHWGLGLGGISVGNASVPLKLCSAENMAKGQQSPCGAIPDSGTTLIMAPKEHLAVLYEGLCDSWERCRQNHTALTQAAKAAREAAAEQYGFNPFRISVPDKAITFQYLLRDCEGWITEDAGLDELPPLHLHVQGSNGTRQTLALPGTAYILAMELKGGAGKGAAGKAHANLTKVVNPAVAGDKKRTVCEPAFGPMEYQTAANGPVWILGTPLFYEFSVGYDLLSAPPSISFTSTRDSPCGACDREAGLVSTAASAGRSRRPRVLRGEPRLPSFDTSRPL